MVCIDPTLRTLSLLHVQITPWLNQRFTKPLPGVKPVTQPVIGVTCDAFADWADSQYESTVIRV
jgi:hypothetical protein